MSLVPASELCVAPSFEIASSVSCESRSEKPHGCMASSTLRQDYRRSLLSGDPLRPPTRVSGLPMLSLTCSRFCNRLQHDQHHDHRTSIDHSACSRGVDPLLSARHLTALSGIMPVHANVFRVCTRRHPDPWNRPRRLHGRQAHRPLSSVAPRGL